MGNSLLKLADPMIAVLVIAIVAALVFPVTGDLRPIGQTVTNVAIFSLFLVNGMRVPRGEILRGMANWRFFLPLGLWVFGVMALGGLGISQFAAGFLDPKVALGFLFLGCLPSTIQSATSYTTIAGGNIALSVVGAALINIAGVFVTAPLFALLGGGAVAEIGNEAIIRIGTILILPFVIGQAVQNWTHGWVMERRAKIVWLDRLVIAIAVFVAFSGAVEQGLATMFSPYEWGKFIAVTLAFLLIANGGAWMASGLLGYPRNDRIAFLFAGAQKSVAIGAPLAAILFAPEIAGFVIAPLLLYHLLQLMLAAPLATHLAGAAD